MIARQDILDTLRMVEQENLDVRTVTLGINLNVCAGRDPDVMVRAVYDRIVALAGCHVAFCDEVSAKYGLPIVNKRIAISPASILLEGHSVETAVKLAQALDRAAAAVRIDLLGGFSALVHKGITPGAR